MLGRICGSVLIGRIMSKRSPDLDAEKAGRRDADDRDRDALHVTVAPIALTAPPKRSCQNGSLITAAHPSGPPPGTSSAGVSSRPTTGETPSVLKKSPLTKNRSTGTVSPAIVSVPLPPLLL